MGIEIERRFLVDGRYDKPWRTGNHSEMCQALPLKCEPHRWKVGVEWNTTDRRRWSS